MTEDRASLPSVLIFAPSAIGGIAEYTRCQAEELARRGCGVTVLCTPRFVQRRPAGCRLEPRLLAVGGTGLLARGLRMLAGIAIYYQLALAVLRHRVRAVLIEANSEYNALFWAWPHVLLARRGVRYVANFHDPVREHRRGPAWLHRLNVRLALAPFHGGLIHAPPPREACIPARIDMRTVPHGIYTSYADYPPAFDARRRLGIEGDATVALAFGHIADRKNLDLLVRTLADIPGMVLVATGAPSSPRERPASFYAALAEELGVASRFHLIEEHVPDGEVSAWFAAADVVALTYAGGFVSQSGVLQVAANWDKPVLASGGPGPLRDTVRDYRLGEFVEPDSAAAIVEGLTRISQGGEDYAARFRTYREHASWARNVDALLDVIS